jgi:hypothetical protein
MKPAWNDLQRRVGVGTLQRLFPFRAGAGILHRLFAFPATSLRGGRP